MPPWYQPVAIQFEPTSKLSYHKFQYLTYVKDINLDAHIRVFKKVIKANGETMQANIINLFGFTLRDNILEWGENFVQNHPNCTVNELEQTFYKHFQTMKNDKEIYMSLRNLQQVGEQVEVYYERLFKLVNYLQLKATDCFPYYYI